MEKVKSNKFLEEEKIGKLLFILGTILNPIIRADGSPKYAKCFYIQNLTTLRLFC